MARKRKAEEEEEIANPVLAELREKARQAKTTLEENDPLYKFIINSFKEEVEKVSGCHVFPLSHK